MNTTNQNKAGLKLCILALSVLLILSGFGYMASAQVFGGDEAPGVFQREQSTRPDESPGGLSIGRSGTFMTMSSEPDIWEVVVNNGSGDGTYRQGMTVTISAYPPEPGKRFKEWVVDYVGNVGGFALENPHAAATTFTMPASTVILTATYEDVQSYSVTVVNGTMGSGSYHEGDEVWINAEEILSDRLFKEWVVSSGGADIRNPTERLTSFIMPASDVIVTAIYQESRKSYDVTVNSGIGGGAYYEGDVVHILPMDHPTAHPFKEWVVNSGGISLADPKATNNSFVMPANPVEITATYEEPEERYYSITIQSDPGGTAFASEVSAGAGTVITLTATADSGYSFKGWQVVSGKATITGNRFTVGEADVVIKALFEKKETSTDGASSSSSSGGSSGSSRITTTSTQVYWIDSVEAQGMVQRAQEEGSAYARSRRSSATSIQKAALKAMAGYSYRHDTVAEGAVQVRISIPSPGQITSDLLVSASVEGAVVDSRRAFFEKWYSNNLRVIHFDQQGSFGQAVDIAAKVDLAGLDTANLVLYSYDKETNFYTRIPQPQYHMDEKGYLHFTTEAAGDIIISEGALQRR